jgi:hypothetical protein
MWGKNGEKNAILIQIILGGREFKFIQIKYQVLLKGRVFKIIAKMQNRVCHLKISRTSLPVNILVHVL